MSRSLLRSLLLATLAGTLLVGANCEDNGPIPPGRDFGAVLHDPGHYQTTRRSQPGGIHTWNGQTLAYVEMTAPAPVSGRVVQQSEEPCEPDSDATSPCPPSPGVCVFLDGPGELGDLSGITDSAGIFSQTIIESTYDVYIAPECFTGSTPAEYIDQGLDGGGSVPAWELPFRSEVFGLVVDTSGTPVEGAVVSVYEAGQPDRPLGITALTDVDGEFTFAVPPGLDYDILVTTPHDGSVPIAPIRIDNQELPPQVPGLVLKIDYPVLPTAEIIGSLEQGSGATTTGRIRVEGWVPGLPGSGTQLTGGTFRAEFETDSDGDWGLELPRGGPYRATAFPRHGDPGLGIATAIFSVDEGDTAISVDLALPDSTLARIAVTQNNGNAMVGAQLAIRMTSPPYYSYLETTGDDGGWTGQLIPDIYEVEVIPPEQPDTGEQRFARAHDSLDLLSSDIEDHTLEVTLRRSDVVDGFLYSVGQEGVKDVHVLLTDPDSGELWDETVTNDSEFPGFFRATLPRP